MLFSVRPQHESAIGTHKSPPFWTSSHLPLPSTPSPTHPTRLYPEETKTEKRHVSHCSLQHFVFCFFFFFFLELLVIALCSSRVTFWTPSDLGSSSSNVVYFPFSCCSWSSPGKNNGVDCHVLLKWAAFCQNSSLLPVHLGCPCKV